METETLFTLLGTAIVAIGIGVTAGYFLRKSLAKNQANSLEAKAEKIMAEAKTKQQELVLEGKEKAQKMIDEAKHEERQAKNELAAAQLRLEKRETTFDQKLLELQGDQTKLMEKVERVKAIKLEIETLKMQQMEKLQAVASLTKDEAKLRLLEMVEEESKGDLMNRIVKLDKENSEVYEAKARDIILDAIQRNASSHSAETTASMVPLPSDDMKGRIIGKEGRNIKTIEKLTGCELIIDDTPDSIMISCFSPIRREVARIALTKLMADGRIQPARIEEFVEKAKQELSIDIRKAGEEALLKMGITGIDPKLVGIVGRLKYRTSYGQNIMNHSMEVGQLAAVIASEIGGVDPAKAKRAGFFHDIGKAVDQETQGAHPAIGYTILKKFNMDDDTCEAARDHHIDHPTSIYACIAKAADAISGARVGARRDTFELFVARLEDLEKTAASFPGVEKVYAIQAGREVRVFIRPNEVDDYGTVQLAKDIARKIEEELQYPGEIRITMIRETRVIEYAR
ncbi:MAG: ribonuclease Y [Candidatus Magasanikbacteria bacterium RIFOXYC2_FULL_42_28]|uniref:Ribonuclease Y n=1 Tax=Candidatus Magasanikbacteria bacterium RIFOXYC2_FULL_42_28 TaxID=1798704 RepID=A0A1F6NV99_9BACT|nr:MAG: ribonuclease Y [Candidatus Magasanikbacteria bacterium RIFOXYC2_FULL_42_28]